MYPFRKVENLINQNESFPVMVLIPPMAVDGP